MTFIYSISILPPPVHGVSMALVAPLIVMGSDYNMRSVASSKELLMLFLS